MGEDVKVDKEKFDALLGAMLSTPPLPKSAVKVSRPRPRHSKDPIPNEAPSKQPNQ